MRPGSRITIIPRERQSRAAIYMLIVAAHMSYIPDQVPLNRINETHLSHFNNKLKINLASFNPRWKLRESYKSPTYILPGLAFLYLNLFLINTVGRERLPRCRGYEKLQGVTVPLNHQTLGITR